MKLIVHGQQAFGKSVLEALLGRGEIICAVFCAPDIDGGRPDPLKVFAQDQGLPVYQPKSYKDPTVWDQIRSLEADLCVMAYVTLMVPEEALNAPRLGTIQYHPSLLPMHKGPSSINWPIINGENKTGLSIFWPDNGLDTGPILLQKDVVIDPDDTLGSLYFNHLFPMGVDAILEAVDLVRDGTALRLNQDPAKGSYEGWCQRADVEIDWVQSMDVVYNLIRGANPQPGAWTTLNGQPVTILDSKKAIGFANSDPGSVVEVDADGISIGCVEGAVRVEKFKPEGAGKMSAKEFLEHYRIEPGARFG
ncbi:MAG: methionyl-tRNA formyltransferase [Candidatus Thioglobus sp. MED-G25]|nr:MAG: methionyl-tRNA formyltransferase [Candidatus Thioglobus sp. MED-G25]